MAVPEFLPEFKGILMVREHRAVPTSVLQRLLGRTGYECRLVPAKVDDRGYVVGDFKNATPWEKV